MKEWILPVSKKYYRIEEAFRDLKIIDWRQTNNVKNISVGDIVYIYVSAPESRIAFKGAVLKTNKPENTIDDSAYTIPPGSETEGPCMEVALFRAYELDGLDINSLKENGLTSNLQCPVTVKEELSNYLHCFDKLQRNADRFSGEIPDVCLYPFPLSVDEGGVDINIPMSPSALSEDGKRITCRNCGSEFMKAPRCTTCGQLIKYADKILPKRTDVLEVNSPESSFRINIDILNEAFGVGRAMYAKAVYPDKKNSTLPGTKQGDRYIIWMPKLYGNSSEWKNVVSENGTEIYEVAEGSRTEDWIDENTDLDVLRLVFVKDTAKSPYRFVGVFKTGKIEFCKHTYCRIATNVKLIGNPVSKIELLDDNRYINKILRALN